MEAQYVSQLEKKFIPVLTESSATLLTGDGGRMLNFMRGTKLYVDMADLDDFDARFKLLIGQLGESGKSHGANQAKRLSGSKVGQPTIASKVKELEETNEAMEKRLTKLEKTVAKLLAASDK